MDCSAVAKKMQSGVVKKNAVKKAKTLAKNEKKAKKAEQKKDKSKFL